MRDGNGRSNLKKQRKEVNWKNVALWGEKGLEEDASSIN